MTTPNPQNPPPHRPIPNRPDLQLNYENPARKGRSRAFTVILYTLAVFGLIFIGLLLLLFGICFFG